ncbi:MAG: hypothetical protein V1859_08470 [archaeon]
MKLRHLIFLVITLFLSISLAHSEIVSVSRDNAFDVKVNNLAPGLSISAIDKIELCDCESFNEKITIKNTGNIAIWASIYSDSKYSTIYPSSFMILPSGDIEINHILNIPCDTASFENNIRVVGTNGIDKEVSRNVIVRNCPDIAIEPLNLSANITPCKKAYLTAKLINPSNYNKEYTISLFDFIGTANIAQKAKIGAKSAKILNFTLQPDCSIYGAQSPILSVESEKYSLKQPISLNVNWDYNFSTTIPNEAYRCIGVPSEFPVVIKNLGTVENVFFVKANSSELNYNYNVSLKPKDEKTIFIGFTPKKDAIATVNINELYGGLTVAKNTRLIVENCYDAEISLNEKNFCVDEEKISLTVNNTGLKIGTFLVSLYSKELGIDTGKLVKLNAGESKTVLFKEIKLMPGNHEISATVTINETQKTKTILKKIEVKSIFDCFKPKVIAPLIWAKRTVPEEHWLMIENTGNRPAEYVLVFEPSWINYSSESISLNPRDKKDIVITTFPKDEALGKQNVNLVLSEKESKQTYNETLGFQVYDYTDTEFISKYKCLILLYLFLGLAVLSAIIIAVFAMQQKSIKWPLLTVLACLVIILLISIVCFSFFRLYFRINYQSYVDNDNNNCTLHFANESLCESSLYHKFNMNTAYSLDLSKYFYDPDSDRLTFTKSDSKNITVIIKENIAKLVPKKDWFGFESISFSADDNKGGTANSGLFIFHVLSQKKFNLIDFAIDYHAYIAAALIIVIVITIVVILRKKEDNLKEAEEANVSEKKGKKKKKD